MSWKKVKLGDFLKVRDNRFKPNDKAIAGLKRIDKIDFSGEIYISDKPSNTDMILIKKGDLIISGINVEKGAMAVYTGDEDITATIHYSSYSFNENDIDIDFLKYFLRSIEFRNALKEQVPGGIKTEIKPKHLLPLKVIIPTDINEQKAVVKILQDRNSKVDAISIELSHQLDLVKKLRQRLLQEAVQGKLVPQDPSDEPASELLKKIKAEKQKLISEGKLKKEKELPPIKTDELPFQIPEGWVWCRLEEIITLVSGQDLVPSDYNNQNNGIPYITGASHFNNGVLEISRWTPRPKSISILNDLLLTCKGTIGSMAFNEIGKIHIARQIMAIRNSFKNDLHYIKYFLTQHISTLLELSKSLIPGISRDNILMIKIPLPPLSEQHRIVQKLDELMQCCDVLEASIQESSAQNEKLLQQILREALRNDTV